MTDVELGPETVEVHLENGSGKLACPECGAASPRYDTRERKWRHLDTMQYMTVLVAEVPRVKCGDHGVRQVRVPWAEVGSGFTAQFERLAIDWLRESNLSAVARLLRLSWDQIDGVQQRAVGRGLARRTLRPTRHLGVDETSFQRRHEYVTVVVDSSHGTVVHVADGRGREALGKFLQGAPASWLSPTPILATAVPTADPTHLRTRHQLPVRPCDHAGEAVLHVLTQGVVRGKLGDLRTAGAPLRVPLRSRGPIGYGTAASRRVAAQLPRNRRR